jgi:agmatinase
MAFKHALALLGATATAREIVFPPVSGYTTSDQVILGGYNDPDISQPKFAGLSTYANLPYVHCLAAEGEEVEKFDIAVLGAPFDTVSCASLVSH